MGVERTVDVGALPPRYRLTKQRAAVLRALSDGSHLSAEEIFARVRAEHAGVSLGTVYRTLDVLRAIGLVQTFSHDSAVTRFEAALQRHHHLYCRSCKSLTNVHCDSAVAPAHAIAEHADYDEIDLALTVTGRCPACRAAAAVRA